MGGKIKISSNISLQTVTPYHKHSNLVFSIRILIIVSLQKFTSLSQSQWSFQKKPQTSTYYDSILPLKVLSIINDTKTIQFHSNFFVNQSLPSLFASSIPNTIFRFVWNIHTATKICWRTERKKKLFMKIASQ